MERRKEMRLKVTNFAKIKEANIEVNGLTIIAGENNTGKSTIGKIMYSIFNSFHNLEDKVTFEKTRSVISALRQNKKFEKIMFKDEYLDVFNHIDVSNYDKFYESISRFNIDLSEEEIEKLIEILNYDDEDIESLIIDRIFSNEFNNQIIPLDNEKAVSNILLFVKSPENNQKVEKCINLSFEKNSTLIKSKVKLYKEGFYIDNPFILDNVLKRSNDSYKRYKYYSLIGIHNIYDSHNDILLDKLSKSNVKENNSLIEDAILEERLRKFIRQINDTIDGDFIENEFNFAFYDSKIKREIELSNLSTGIKSFIILLKLIKNHDITDNSLIVLDEPEIHLHPKWQLEYAKLLVLLQKEFNLNIILTSHSPYFINAIEVYSAKYDIANLCKYYFANPTNEGIKFEDVTLNIGKIYKVLSQPLLDLEDVL